LQVLVGAGIESVVGEDVVGDGVGELVGSVVGEDVGDVVGELVGDDVVGDSFDVKSA